MDGLSQNVSIQIYNLLGQHVRALVENKDQIGQFKVQWNGRDKFGQHMASGVYFIQLTTQTGIVKNKKMMLLK
jgi:flagellar hook assembly protein FlgD